MNSEIEKAWINLAKYLGVAQPSSFDNYTLMEWAKPDKPHPSRKHRPLLMNILEDAKNGSLSKYLQSELLVDKERINLGSVFEFQTLLNLSQDKSMNQDQELVLSVVKQISPKAMRLLENINAAKFSKFADFVNEFIVMDEQMYTRSITTKEQFESERSKLGELREALIELDTHDKEDRLNFLQSFEKQVLVPMIRIIRITENTRSVYSQNLKGAIADVLMAEAGMQIVAMDFPDFSMIEKAVEKLPRLEEKEVFERFKAGSGIHQVQNLVDEFCEEIQERFDTVVDINPIDALRDLGKREIHLPININLGGEQKNVYFNPNNTFEY